MRDELILCPIATTEGAIVASASRGANAITRSGVNYLPCNKKKTKSLQNRYLNLQRLFASQYGWKHDFSAATLGAYHCVHS